MYNVNNNGPSMDPWGTPYDMSILSDVTFYRDTDWVLSVKIGCKPTVLITMYTIVPMFCKE